MTGFSEPMARVFAAGLALAAGYGAAAYAGTSRSQPVSVRAPAFFDGGRVRAGYLPGRIVAGRGPVRAGGVGEWANHGGGNQPVTLAWAPVPAVPEPLTDERTRVPRDESAVPPLPAVVSAPPAVEARAQRAEKAMPVLSTLAERMGMEGVGAQLIEDSPLFGAKKRRSEPGRIPMSRSASLSHVYSHAGDPLAVLQLDDAPAPEFIMPFANGRVTSLFNDGRRHPAIDLGGKLGSPVLATTSSQKIVFAGPRGGYGNAVITVDEYGRTHLYGHLQRITSRVGQMLEQGDQLGHLGSTGHSTGPHVHYEVTDARGVHINPVTLLFPGRRVAKGYAWLDVRQESVGVRVAARSR
jgi:murein DD-endopeptidase MepM/ murein hydrolase activator NlpD